MEKTTFDFTSIQPKQLEALRLSLSTPVLFFGGAKGGGKSWLVRCREISRRLKYPGTQGLIVRRTYPELRANHIVKMFQEYPVLNEWYNKAEKIIYYPNGSTTEFSYLKNTDDVYTYQGREYQDITVDEITQHEEEVFKTLRSSLRTSVSGIKPTVFLTGNPGGVGHCVPFGEVLTSDGWQDISTIKVGDYVMSDVDGETRLVKVDQTIVEEYDGNLLLSDNWSARFTCTPNHKIVRVTETKNNDGRTFHKPSLIEVSQLSSVTRLPEIGRWKGYEISSFTIADTEKREKRKPQPLTLVGDDYCELMGWYLSEGYYSTKLGYFGISQTKEPNRLLIEKLLTRCGFNYRWDGSAVIVYSRSWADYFSVFGKCRTKFVPQILKEAPPEQLQLFLDAIMLGDGHGNHYYTISKRLADDIAEIGLKLAKRVYLSSRQRNNRNGLTYDVSLKENKLGWLEKSKIRTEHYNGKVYCLGIDGIHRFYLRQNGTVFLSGNSWIKRIFVDRNFREGENPDDFAFVQAFVTDNKALMEADPEYVKRLEDLPEHLRKAYLEGDWNIFAGQMFTMLTPSKHIIDPIKLPPGTQYFAGYDYGFNHPFAFVLCALTPAGEYFVVSHIRERFVEVADQAALMLKMLEGKNRVMVYAGHDIFNKESGKTIEDQLLEAGFARSGHSIVRAAIDHVNGVAELRKAFSLNPAGIPYLRFFRNAQPVYDCIAEQQIDPNKPEDVIKLNAVDGEGGDDLYDSLRYAIRSWTLPNKTKKSIQPGTGEMLLQKRLELAKQKQGGWR